MRIAMRLRPLLSALSGALLLATPAVADELLKLETTLKNHSFAPAEIHVPAGRPALLTIKNEDPTPEEFDSSALHMEKVITGGGTASIRLRPLGAGRFPFMGEFHPDTAQGVIVAE